MSDQPKKPLLPLEMSRGINFETGDEAKTADDATMGRLIVRVDGDEVMRAALEADHKGIGRLMVVHHTMSMMRLLNATLAADVPPTIEFESAPETSNEETGSDAAENDTDEEPDQNGPFGEGDVICFGLNGIPESWTYGVFIENDQGQILYRGLHRELGQSYIGLIPPRTYVINEVPTDFYGMDGLIHAMALFEPDLSEHFYRSVYKLIDQQDLLYALALDRKRVQGKAAELTIGFMEDPKRIEELKRESKDRGPNFLKLCDDRIRALRGASIKKVVDPPTED